MAIVISYKLTGIETLTRMQVVNAFKRALLALGAYWHDAMAWKRFTQLGYSEYGFARRSPRYDKAKVRHLRHNNPLVRTGEGRDEALHPSTVARIRVTRDSVTIPMPRKFNRYNPRGPNMAEEVRAVSRAEIQILEDRLVMFIDDELAREVKPEDQGANPRVQSLRLHGMRGGQRIVNPVARRSAA
jgi:hypothetical protein